MRVLFYILTFMVALATCDSSGTYSIDASHLRQQIWGIGYEIQSDSIGSGNSHLPDKISGVPHDLISSERARFFKDMLPGFRYCRLALGLYLRGLDQDQKHILGRWSTQMEELQEMQDISGISGFAVEYWSPAPYWKGPNQDYICASPSDGQHPRSLNNSFLNEFSDAMVQDALYLDKNGLNVEWWGLQNEPYECVTYSSMIYNASSYLAVFNATAPKLKAALPNVHIPQDKPTNKYTH